MYKSNLSKLRAERGITQSKLAEKSGVAISKIQRIEMGAINVENITLKTAVKLADALGVSANCLLE